MPRTGKASKIARVSLPTGVLRSLDRYSNLTGSLRSQTFARLLRAGLLVYFESKRRLLANLGAEDSTVSAHQDQTGVGEAVIEDLKRVVPNTEGVVFSVTTKGIMDAL